MSLFVRCREDHARIGIPPMSENIESRPTRVERAVELLKSRLAGDKSNWVAEITGIFKDDPDFDEIVRLGKEMRDAEEPEDDA